MKIWGLENFLASWSTYSVYTLFVTIFEHDIIKNDLGVWLLGVVFVPK